MRGIPGAFFFLSCPQQSDRPREDQHTAEEATEKCRREKSGESRAEKRAADAAEGHQKDQPGIKLLPCGVDGKGGTARKEKKEQIDALCHLLINARDQRQINDKKPAAPHTKTRKGSGKGRGQHIDEKHVLPPWRAAAPLLF